LANKKLRSASKPLRYSPKFSREKTSPKTDVKYNKIGVLKNRRGQFSSRNIHKEN